MFKLFFHRITLAALHFNENTKRQQAVNREGQNQYSISFLEARKMEAVVREIKVEQTFSKCKLHLMNVCSSLITVTVTVACLQRIVRALLPLLEKKRCFDEYVC